VPLKAQGGDPAFFASRRFTCSAFPLEPQILNDAGSASKSMDFCAISR
jgi:hypothetical protein